MKNPDPRRARGLAAAFTVIALAPAFAHAAPLALATAHFVSKTAGAEITIDYPHTAVPRIDRAIEAYVHQEAEALGGSTDDDPTAARPYTLELHFDVARNDDAMFVVMFTGYADTGGAHPNWDAASFNFLRRDGALVDLSDLIDAERGASRVSSAAIAQISRRMGANGDRQWIVTGASADMANFKLFEWLPTELRIFLPPYQVASHADGVQDVSIPLSQLRDIVKADPHAHAASFGCAKAGSTSERAICGDGALQNLDLALGRAYAAARRSAATSDKSALRTQQRQWLVDRDRSCGGDIACLARLYRARLKALGGGA